MVVVEAVGARPSPQASCATEQSSATSAAAARVEILAAERGLRACQRFTSPNTASPVMLIRRYLQTLDGRQQSQDIFRLAAGRKRQHHISTYYHAEVAVHGVHGMHE